MKDYSSKYKGRRHFCQSTSYLALTIGFSKAESKQKSSVSRCFTPEARSGACAERYALEKFRLGGAEKINRKQTLYDRDLTGAELTGAVVATVDGHQFFWDPAALDPLKLLE